MPMIDVYAASGLFAEQNESPEGGWGIAGDSNMQADIAAPARAAVADSVL